MRELQSKRLSNNVEERSQKTDSTESRPQSPVPQGPSSPEERAITVRKAPRGNANDFATHNNEMGPPSVTGIRVGTPPREILTLSPGSESQTLRRKAIVDSLTENRVKRTRLEFVYESAPIASSQLQSEGLGSNLAEDPQDGQPNMEDTAIAAGHDHDSQSDVPMEDVDTEEEHSPKVYWDPQDEVYRCAYCKHELLISRGECTMCSTGDEGIYFEVSDPDLGPRPRFVLGDDVNDMDLDERTELLGDCLDFDSSAYDSYDERDEFDDEYEINSFISDDDDDDDKIVSDADNEDEDADLETDYRQKFRELLVKYQDLQDKLMDAMIDYDGFKIDILGSDYDEGEEDFYNPFEGLGGFLMVDVAPLDPVVAEVILSESEESQDEEPGTPDSLMDEIALAEAGTPDSLMDDIALTEAAEQSQKTEALPEEEENARAEAFEAALDGRWHVDVSLVSTSGNHTHEDVEL